LLATQDSQELLSRSILLHVAAKVIVVGTAGEY
jgi:hypothetical protein